MRLLDTFSLATRKFKNRPMRTALTVLGVSIGIGTVLFLVSFGYGLQNTILSRITTEDSLLSLDVNPGISGLVELNQQSLNEFSQIEGVRELSRLVTYSSQIILNDLTGDGLVNIIDPSFFRLGGILVSAGDYFAENDNDGAVISSAAAQLFNLGNEDILGQKIKLTLFVPSENAEGFEEIEVVETEKWYTVRGVVNDDNTSYVYVSIDSLAGLEIAKYDQVKLMAVSNDVIESIRNAIIERGFLVSSLSDTIEQANKIFQIVQIILFSFGFVALIVSAIGMFNTMTIALLERINEIGIMRSIGITKKDIRRMFLLEAVIMGFLGGIGGIAVGFIAGELVNIGINVLASNFGGQPVDLFYSPIWFVSTVTFFSSVVGFLTGIYPSMKASRLNPLDALRYK